MGKINIQDIEIALARHFDYRANVIVPNISWSFLNYEADVVILRPSGWAIEIEIKTTAQDITRDIRKGKFAHNSELFRELWFAVPDSLKLNMHIPLHAGVISVSKNPNGTLRTNVFRVPIKNRSARKWTEAERTKLHEVGILRIWTLKEHLAKERGKRLLHGKNK